MGDSFEVAVDVEATLDDAPRLASTVIEWLTADGIIDATPTAMCGDRATTDPDHSIALPLRTRITRMPSRSHSRDSVGSRS